MAAPLAVAGGMAAAGIGGSLVGGIMGNQASKKAMAQEMALREAALQVANQLKIPEIDAQKLVLENPQQVWDFIPEREKAMLMDASAMEDVAVDPRLEQAQMDALAGLEERAADGLTAEDMAMLRDVQRQTGGAEQARQQSILANMEQRGLGGSGAELATRLKSNQDASRTAAEAADRIAIASQQAKMNALSGMGNLAGQIRSQSFGEQSDVAKAQDIINQFNTQQRAGAQQRNVDAANTANLQRANLQQQLETNRANLANQEQQYNKELLQQNFANERDKAQMQMGALLGQAAAVGQYGQNKAANTANMWSGIGQALSSGIGAYGAYNASETDNTK